MFETLIAELKGFEVAGLGRRELCDVTAAVGRARGALDALEVRVAAAVDDLGDAGSDAASMMRTQGRCSKREAARRARRAERLRNMPNTSRKLAEGEITAEHADALADAAAATSEAEVDDDERLLSDASARPADMAGKDIREWVGRHQSNADREEKHRRQRAQRSLKIFDGDDGMTVAHCRTDTVTGEQLRARVEDLARRLYRDDGGRDGRDGVKPRSWEQLRHDALMILVGVASGAAGSTKSTRPAGSSSSGRSQVIVVADAEVIAGGDGRCEIPGVGPLPMSVLERLGCDAEILGHIYDRDGQPLWHGRSVRTVTAAQWQALVVRDGGCVICAARPAHCEAHHVVPWIRGGPTDLDNLALVCVRHHHDLHDHHLALTRDRRGNWQLRARDRPTRRAAA